MSKSWFITGVSGGIGRHLAELALSEGDSVFGTTRRPDALRDLAKTYGNRLAVEQLDVTLVDDVRNVTSRALARGRIEIVVNNAGGGIIGATEEMTDDQVQNQIALNLLAPIHVTRAFLKPMREQGGGRIIQISSIGGQVAFPVSSAYHAAKWGLEGFTEAVSQEVAEFGIHFTLVEPGAVRTGFQSNLQWTTETPPYKDSAVGKMRQWLKDAGDTVSNGDPAKLARAIFDTTRAAQPPLRLALGSDAYDMMHAAWRDRIAKLESQEAIARSIGFSESRDASWNVAGPR
jgi:NAD(P)-dependent dehydrogenase (short-subunit alcohol dehydrogenase family)